MSPNFYKYDDDGCVSDKSVREAEQRSSDMGREQKEEARRVRDEMRSGKIPRTRDNQDFLERNGIDL